MSDTQTVLTIEGMHCASCTGRVERALLADPNVTTAFVNLTTSRATVRHANDPSIADRLVEIISQAGYPASTEISDNTIRLDADAQNLRRDLWISAVMAIPVVILAMGPHLVPAFHDVLMNTIGHRANLIIQMFLTTLILAGPGRRFFTTGIPALLRLAPEMNSLVAIGTGAALGYSTLVVIAPFLFPVNHRDVYFEAAAVVVTLILLGRYFEAKAKGRTGIAIQNLLELQPDIALVERDGTAIEIPFSEIAQGDIVLIKPGARIPVDGPVISGQSFVDESMISGEPLPVEKTTDATLIAGTLNGSGALRMTAQSVGSQTTLSKIIAMVEDAQGTKLPIQALVDRVTFVFVPIVLVIAVVTVAIWLLSGAPSGQALVAGVSVLIIACPCAMGLATPTSVIVGSGRAAQDGVLFRKGDALQTLQNSRVIAFDKTGTLTEGKPTLATLDTDGNADETLCLIASVEQFSEHPIAKAIVEAATAKGLRLSEPQDFVSDTGFGVSGIVDGKIIRVGTPRYLNLPLTERMDDLARQGQTVFMAQIDGAVAVFGVTDQIKETSKHAIDALKKTGRQVAMITGDGQATAAHVAAQLGIDTVIADVLPDGKTDAVTKLQSEFGPVTFVGDGINDAPALATADTGIAIGTGTDIAIESADVVLMSGELNAVARAFEISHATMGNIKQNLFWAFVYNAALIPVAAGVLYPSFGITLSPILASAAMGLSSVFVVSNALRLHRA